MVQKLTFEPLRHKTEKPKNRETFLAFLPTLKGLDLNSQPYRKVYVMISRLLFALLGLKIVLPILKFDCFSFSQINLILGNKH